MRVLYSLLLIVVALRDGTAKIWLSSLTLLYGVVCLDTGERSVVLVVSLRRHGLLRVAVLPFVVELFGRRRRRSLEARVCVDVVGGVFVFLCVRVEQVLARVGRASVRRTSVDLALGGTLLLVVFLGRHRLSLLAHRQRPAQASARLLAHGGSCVVAGPAQMAEAQLVPEPVLLLLLVCGLRGTDGEVGLVEVDGVPVVEQSLLQSLWGEGAVCDGAWGKLTSSS